MSKILSPLDGVLYLMDDILVFGKDQTEHVERLKAVFLQKIETAGATLNPSKCEFRRRKLKFLGQIVDEQGIRADPYKLTAITEMVLPTNISELRLFMGMVNQLGKFSMNMADLTQSLRQLLSKTSTWFWDPAQDQAFAKVKEELTKPTVLALCNPQARTKVCVDASSYGLGAVLMQKKDDSWRPVSITSRSMSETEQKYE